jgi:CubicO group peptidase (beta-lactamase class C family)
MSDKTRLICLNSSLLALFLLFFQPIFAQYNFGELDAEWAAKQKLLGKDAILMLANKDSIMFRKEAGNYNLKTTQPIPIASCSKWLTAALVMQFVDEGKLSLDDKITKWLPEFEKYGKTYITVRLCLSHETGITDESGFFKTLLQRSKFATLEEQVNSFARRDIRTNAGTDFWYGTIGLNIAGRILEVISKKQFDALIKQKLFNPLGMRKTSFSTMDGSAINPSGGAVSTPDDYMKFLMMLLNKGKANGKQILSEASVEALRQVQTASVRIAYAPKAATGFAYALGSWVAEEKDGKASVLASPGLLGTWPMIDFCRGYAYLVFVRNLLGEERAEAHMELKKVIDEQIKSNCQ